MQCFTHKALRQTVKQESNKKGGEGGLNTYKIYGQTDKQTDKQAAGGGGEAFIMLRGIKNYYHWPIKFILKRRIYYE